MKVIAIIPARYASTRFPGKALCDIAGKTMIQRVYEKVQKSAICDQVIVATDDDRIEQEVIRFGGTVVRTRNDHESGTDRIIEAFEKLKIECDVVLNIQGDEPFLDPNQINELASCFQDPNAQIATLVRPAESKEEINNPNCVKIVKTKQNYALYFSRSTIPFHRDQNNELSKQLIYIHTGVYGFRSKILNQIGKLEPTVLEMSERLEQLRWLENDFRIKLAISNYRSFGIDSPEDLEEALNQIVKNPDKN